MNKRAKDTFTRSDIEASLKKEFPNLSKSDISNAVDSISNVIINSIALDEKVEIRGFGTFFSKKIKEKFSARNPASGKLIYVPEKNKVRFRASKKLKALINK